MNKGLHIKVCGMKNVQNLEDICLLEPDYVGFIFVEQSPRFVGRNPDPALFRIPGKGIRRIGVFVDASEKYIREQLDQDRIDGLQLHGSESPQFCCKLRQEGITVIKALPSASLREKEALVQWKDAVDHLLIDSPSKGQGGSGHKFDWSLLEKVAIAQPFFLSGGIAPGDAGSIRTLQHPLLYGVDVNSGFEQKPGLKDVEKLRHFIKELRTR